MQNDDQLFERARKLIADSPFQSHQNLLQSVLIPSFRLAALKRENGNSPMGGSRLGGLPGFPKGWAWPRWNGYEHQNKHLAKKPVPLSFIGQLNLGELQAKPPGVPESGVLYFFVDTINQPWGYDPKDKGGFRVLYFDGPEAELVVAESPSDLDSEYVFPACVVTSSRELTLPDWMDGFDYEKDGDAYRKLLDALAGSSGETHHRFLGHPQAIQGDMPLECQLVSHGLYCGNSSGYEDPRVDSLRIGAKDWQLLLQIDTDEDNPGWMWGDCGRIYYWIRRDDLAAAHFEDAWMCLQCY